MLKLKLIKKEPLKLKITSRFPSIILANLQDKEVNPSSETQTITADKGFDGLGNVRVNAVLLQSKMTIPSKKEQTIVADEGFNGLNEVKINPVTSEVDENIIAENIRDGVEILGVAGNFVGSKYAPRVIKFSNYSGPELDYELANLDTSNIVSMNQMFYQCISLTNLDLSNFDTSNVTNMSYMFDGCRNINSLNLSSFNTSKVTNINCMFRDCYQLTTLDLSNFNVSKVTNMGNMFYNCRRLTKLVINNPTLFELKQVNVFNNTPIAGYTDYTDGELGYVYVPDDLVETYKTTTVWSTYADQIKGLSELPQD